MNTVIEKFIFLNQIGLIEGAIVSLLFLIVIYGAVRYTRRLRSVKKKIFLISLRSLSFLLIVFILLNPAIRTETYNEEKPRLAILIDNSMSMSLPGDEAGISRIQAVRNFFENHKAFFTKLEENFYLSYYSFDKTLKPASLNFINTDEPSGTATDIGEAIKELDKNYDTGELDAVILFSDGANNGTILKKTSDEFFKTISFPINTVAAASGDNLRDIWIDSIKASVIAFVRYPLSIDVVIKSIGFKASNIPVTLKDGDKIVSTEEISIDPNDDNKVEFILNPTSLGRKVYTVSIPALAGETIKENNQKSFVIDVVIDKVRVLHIAGSPSWDVRFLRMALKRNPNVDLVSFFILREASDMVFASQNELSLIPFPVDELFGNELSSFDVVIFHNFDFRPYGIYSLHLRSLRDYVMEKGGSFLMIGGDKSFDSGSYGGTPISEILPVELNPIPPRSNETYSTESFHAMLTPIGHRHPVTRVIPNEKENEGYWKNMPELAGFNKVEGLKPEAIPLLITTHGEPILVLNQVKSGRVASFLSDSFWEWVFVRAGEGELAPYYETFLNRILLWLVSDPELNNLRVRTEKTSYDLRENAKLDILHLDYGDNEEKIEAYVVLPNGVEKELNIEKTSYDRFASEVETDQYGVYKVKVKTRDGGLDNETDNTEDEIPFLVDPPINEIKSPTIDQELLKNLAKKTAGLSITVNDNPDGLGIDFSPKKIISGYKTRKIWDKPWFFMLLVAFLSSEWLLGRRWGLR